MEYSDINRERRNQIKSGWQTDKAIIGGVKKAAKAVAGIPKKISELSKRKDEYLMNKVHNKLEGKVARPMVNKLSGLIESRAVTSASRKLAKLANKAKK